MLLQLIMAVLCDMRFQTWVYMYQLVGVLRCENRFKHYSLSSRFLNQCNSNKKPEKHICNQIFLVSQVQATVDVFLVLGLLLPERDGVEAREDELGSKGHERNAGFMFLGEDVGHIKRPGDVMCSMWNSRVRRANQN
jgi:hypothetical protein